MPATKRRSKVRPSDNGEAADLDKLRLLLADAADRFRESEAAAQHDRDERDRLIRDAIRAKIPRREIIELTKISSARVEQIKRGKRL